MKKLKRFFSALVFMISVLLLAVCGCATHEENRAYSTWNSAEHHDQNSMHVVCPHCGETISIDYVNANIIHKASQYLIVDTIYKCPHCFKDFVLPQPELVTSYAEKSATQTSNVETAPYPIFSGHRYSSETESRNIHIDYDEERWGNNWWFGYSFHFRDYYRKTNSVRTYNTHRHYHRGH